ncbi:zinc-binding metallopeptidase [Pinibacter aurantiacus]|uniref:Zinc-binding metallopeptidase n=1 Tax=Pinibacter aurantiacus TaxID=2851599 RepID=A0A9E2S799_9BACT|nr:putative zinc-binding metallopeptidase [Pinibacter aurantiacus]MBV4356922.1 putative zinc-binding metallopeptidase [Pinibacter aurantiacus]
MKLLKIITLVAMLGTIASCKKDENLNTNIPGLGGDSWVASQLDKWLYDSLTHPYNIEVKYKWDQSELDLNKTLVPPIESQVQPVLDALRQIWINTYIAEAGATFFKKYSPKLIVMVGSPSFNPDGSITLGTAEGGRRVVLYDVNDYDNTDVNSVQQMVHVVEHEFGHILNQNQIYPPEFKQISVGKYTANWINESDDQANSEGFISAYAKSAPDEDFVEMISLMLSNGRMWFEMMVNSQSDSAQSALRSKEQYVISYYKTVWNIDFYALQTDVQNALTRVTGRPTLASVFGFGKTYTSAVWSAAVTGSSPDFKTIFDAASTSLDGSFGLTLDSMKVTFTAANRIRVQMFFGGYQASFTYSFSTDANGVMTLTYLTADSNGGLIKDDVQGLLDYFSQYHFTLDWGFNRDSNANLGAFIPQEDPKVYYVGILE